jgi:hypothetical protein
MGKPLFKIRENGKYGFINDEGEVVIEAQYFEAEDFYNGFSRVKFNDKLVPLDSMGRLLLKHLFNHVSLFEEHLACAKLVSLWGYIDERGTLVIDVQFEDAKDFSENLAAVRTAGRYGYINKEADFIIKPQYDTAGLFKNQLFAIRV